MCGFKPGDEVMCVQVFSPGEDECREGEVYIVDEVFVVKGSNLPAVILRGVENEGVRLNGRAWRGRAASRFRKVQRRDLSAWLKTSVGNTDKLDKRQKAGARA